MNAAGLRVNCSSVARQVAFSSIYGQAETQ